MREFRPYGSVRGAPSNGRPYRDLLAYTDFDGRDDGRQALVPSGWQTLSWLNFRHAGRTGGIHTDLDTRSAWSTAVSE